MNLEGYRYWVLGIFQEKQVAVPYFKGEPLVRRQAQDMAQDHSDHPGMGDHQEGGSKGFVQVIKKGKHPVIEVIETFSPGGAEGIQLFAPLFKGLGLGFLDMVKGEALPGAQVDFIEPWIPENGFSRADEVCRVKASAEGAGKNPIKLDIFKCIFPEQGLGHAGFIQGNLGLADETTGLMALDLAVAQQIDKGAVIGEWRGWIGLQPLRFDCVSGEQLHIV